MENSCLFVTLLISLSERDYESPVFYDDKFRTVCYIVSAENEELAHRNDEQTCALINQIIASTKIFHFRLWFWFCSHDRFSCVRCWCHFVISESERKITADSYRTCAQSWNASSSASSSWRIFFQLQMLLRPFLCC